jgi:DNA-binding winged helix-turn-helix (wHTH) protein
MSDVAEASSFWIDRDNLCLRRSRAGGEDERVRLTPKSFNVLRYLADNPGRLVTHDEMLEALWPGVHVQPEVLKTHILALRTALGDTISSPRFIETERGRGYRFIGRMRASPSPAGKPGPAVDLGMFAGRADPMRRLLALLERAAAGERQTAFIGGESGFGKTTLVQQFLAQASTHADFVVAQGQCVESFAGAEPYFPIFEALGELCKNAGAGAARALEAMAPSWAAQMPAQFSAAQRTALQQQAMTGAPSRMVREACSLFEALAAERPLILVLEDLHWADFATIDLFSALCRRRSCAKLLLIATYRPEGSTAAQRPLQQMTQDLALRKFSTEIELTPLSAAAIAQIVSGGTGDEADSSEFCQFLKKRTGGNPLFMRVLLEHLLQNGEVERNGLGWRPLIPLGQLASETHPTLRRAIETKFEGMTNEQRRMLEAASVAGDHFDPATAARAAEMDERSFEAVCEGLTSYTIRHDRLLTLPDNRVVRTYAFNHAVYRQVLYDRIGPLRLVELHRVIGERLEEIYSPELRDDLAIRLAQHFALARDWSRSLNYLRSALRIANSRFARRDALAIVGRAVELAANLPDSARILAEMEFLERRAAIEAAAHSRAALDTYAQLRRIAAGHGDLRTECRALIGLSYAVSWDDLNGSLRVLEDLLAICERQSDPIERDVTQIFAYARRIWGGGWNRDDAARCEEALIRLRVSGDRLAIARGLAGFSLVCMISTRYREARELVVESLRALGEEPRHLVEADLARIAWMRHVGVPWALFSSGEFGAALAEFDATIATCEKDGDLAAARSFKIYRGVFLFHAMDFEGVLQACGPMSGLVSDNVELAGGVLPVERRIALIFCGLAEAGLGHGVVAMDYLRAAEAEMARQAVHLDWYWRLALEWGMVNALIAVGDNPTAVSRAGRLCDLAAQTDEQAWQALAWEARARSVLALGKGSEAMADVARALIACDGVTVPLAEWRVHATAAMVHKAAGDIPLATKHSCLGAAIRERLAGTLPQADPLQSTFVRRSGAIAAT